MERATETTCYLERLAVLPQHRGSGYGTRLVRHALTQAQVMGAAKVGIGIIAADSGLNAFYQSLGFEAGQTKRFAHLPFEVAFMRILI
jgi:ribosomal protein S18 acetylase RimI-like enzyme